MKRRMVSAAAAILLAGALAGCSGGQDSPQAEGDSSGKTELTLFHFQEQYQEQFDKLAQLYAAANPDVTLSIECIGGDYEKILQTRVASGEVPDIFMSGPYTKNENYASISYELQDEEFVKEISLGDEFVASNGALTAIPVLRQVWGILYNQEVFDQVGIAEAPQTLSELKEVCGKIEAAGITPFVMGCKTDYVKTQMYGFPYASDDNYKENIGQLKAKEKKLGDFEFAYDILNMAEVVRDNMQDNPYNDDFATAGAKLGTGEGAMMVCGDQIVQNALKANPDCQIGIMPLPVSEDAANTKLYTCSSAGLHINKDSKHLEEALDFMEWLVASEEVKDWFSNDMQVLSDIPGVEAVSKITSDAEGWIEAGMSAPWGSYFFPQGLDKDMLPAYDKFLLGEISKEETVNELSAAWEGFE